MTSSGSARCLLPSALLAAMLFALATQAQSSVVISNAATKRMSCSAGVCSPTAANAVLNTADLSAMLNASDVEVTTGSGAVTIGVTSPLSWVSSNRLTLDAQHGISIRSTVIVEGTGGLTMTIDDGAAGKLNFYPGASVTFWDLSSSLIINGNTYTLAGDIATLAADIKSNPKGFYALAGDYDASVDGTYTSSPIPTALTGTFEGLGHAVANVSITVDYPGATAGLFSGIFGSVRDFGVKQGSVYCIHKAVYMVGLLAGQSGGNIENTYATGGVSCIGDSFAGGLVGYTGGGSMINHSSAAVSVNADDILGGLVGVNGGTIADSFATGNVGGGYNSNAGGLAGASVYLIDDSHATGRVSGGERTAGGLVGLASGTIKHSYATGSVAGRHYTGGLIGSDGTYLVDSSYATGAVSGEQFVGGLIGGVFSNLTQPMTTNSYATGAVTGGRDAGGLIGAVKLPFTQDTDTYWDLDTTGISDPSRGVGNVQNYPGVTGLTDVQLKAQLPSGFDPAIWGQNAAINNGYPYLLANPPQ